MEDNPYRPPQAQTHAPSVQMPHSVRGIVSFVLVLVSVVIEFGALATSVVAGNRLAGTSYATAGGFFLLGGFVLALLAVGIGIDALLLHCRGRRKLFAILGVVGGFALIAFLIGGLVLGLVIRGRAGAVKNITQRSSPASMTAAHARRSTNNALAFCLIMETKGAGT